MNNEKYVNHYVEILTATMTDSVVRNISLQANAKITEEILTEQTKTIEELRSVNEQLRKEIENTKNSQSQTQNTLQSQLNELNSKREEYDRVLHQVQHVDTFRNELLNARKENEELRNQIAILTTPKTPAKKQKITPVVVPSTQALIEDGGSF
jgi:predicted RNase H-like nuclease (RuvC/YqgF family)